MTALVTGGRGGIGHAIVKAHGDAVALDLPEFDVGSQEAWASLEGEFDAAFLNAGIGIGYPDVSELPDDEIARIVDANFLGVVYGARECARRLMPNGGSIVCTASLAGLTGMPFLSHSGLVEEGWRAGCVPNCQAKRYDNRLKSRTPITAQVRPATCQPSFPTRTSSGLILP